MEKRETRDKYQQMYPMKDTVDFLWTLTPLERRTHLQTIIGTLIINASLPEERMTIIGLILQELGKRQ